MTLPIELVRGQSVENVGLVIAKHTPPLRGESYGEFVRQHLAPASPGGFYARAFRRWQRQTPPHPDHRVVLRVEAESPLLIGMGEPTPGENGLSHHHAYGVPHIPGSSLKGVARAWCAQRFEGDHPWAPGGESFRRLFGRSAEEDPAGVGEAGGVDFLDALPEPKSVRWVADILTPHHADYYQGGGRVPPRGLSGPNPVTFLGATGRYRVVLEGPPAWTKVARRVLLAALAELGVGAKTRAGYGRLRPTIRDLDAEDASQLKAILEGDFASLSFDTQLEILGSPGQDVSIRQSVRAWILGQEPQLEKVSQLLPTPARCRAIAAWLQEQGEVQRWRRKADKDDDASCKELVAFVETWLIDQETKGVPPEPSPPAGPFGDAAFTPPTLSRKEVARNRTLNRLSEELSEGGYAPEAVAAALLFMEQAGAKLGTLNRVRRAYGLEEAE